MVADLPRRWRWAIGAMCALALALLLAFVMIGRGGDSEATAAPRPRVAASFGSAIVASERAVPSVAPRPRGWRGPDEVEVCGGVWARTRSDGSIDRNDLMQVAGISEARKRVWVALRGDPAELARAATLLLEVPDNGAARDVLARLAVSSTDPRVYALAFHACGRTQGGQGACQLLSAGQWARLDPGNASPWLFMLSAAKARNDRAAQNEALHRIATAQRSDVGTFAIAGLVANAAASDEASMLGAWSMSIQAIGVAAAWPIPYQDLLAACRGETLRDANRRQTCDAIADVLTDRSDTLIERQIGTALGRQVGWSAERIDRLRGESAAYAASFSASEAAGARYGCAEIQRDLDTVRRHAANGEVGTLRDWVAQSGKAPQDFVREERARQTVAQASQASRP